MKDNALRIVAHVGIDSFLASNGWIGKRRYNIAYRTLSGESRIVDSEIVDDWKNDVLLQKI
jgi:hypothetical protein